MVKAKPTKERELIFVIAGKDDALVGAECDKLLAELLSPEEKTTGLFSADPAEVSATDVLDELRTLPFLTERRVLVVRGADKFVSANRELLERYFDNPCPTGTLVLTVNTWDSRTKLAKKLGGVGRLISVTQPKAWELPQRLIGYTHDAHGKNMGKDAAELLIELTGDELGRLYGEIDKLAIFADAEKAITAEHVEQLTGHNRLFNAFAVIDAVVAGDAGQAVERLRRMFAEDKSTEYTTVGAFAFHFRRMFSARAMLEDGVRPADIASRLRIWHNKEGFFLQLRRLPLNKIGDIMQKLADIDYAVKTGRTKAHVAIEQLVLGLASG
ncbi:MAG TPA: DNA polymerase III subunit delta [Sedimentisphaerales bacterium]|nr:DNA polymerase III subunit delta [Sedimentisphaerales bacterium]